ncbi:MAG: hypothetical protein ACRDZM_16260 [Acidimicrobiia bacterium]
MHCGSGQDRPESEVGTVPDLPTAYFGWGILPDQYGRRWSDDDGGEGPLPSDPRGNDLPPLLPEWSWRRQVPD